MGNDVARRTTALPPLRGETTFRWFGWLTVHLASLITSQDWRGGERIPDGGVLVVANHISKFDPIALGHFVMSEARRWPRFIGKADLWRAPVIGHLARGCKQIPVERNGPRARDVVVAAGSAIADGQCVCIYPEGTITGDEGTWPMVPRTGAARIALATGCPVIPVAQWGANHFMPGKKLTWPRIWPRKTMHMLVGDPVPLEDLREQEITHELLVEAGDRIIDAITALLEELRGEPAPPTRYDIRTGKRVEHR